MFNGSEDLIWSPEAFRLPLQEDLCCGVAADGKIPQGWLLCSVEQGGIIRVETVSGQKAPLHFGQALATLSAALP